MDLGVKAGIDEYSASARINQYERGKHTPDYSTACSLAKVLSIPVAYFYAEDDLMAELITTFGKLNTASQKKLLNSIQLLIDSD
jgi:transcriptional regulator with XRE-family HTH domain